MNALLFLLMLIIPAIAQIMVSLSFNKYKQIANQKQLTGYDVARKILDQHGLEKMYIVETKGIMSDHYDPNQKVIRLSNEVYNGTSIASLAIAAHECGHALQDKEGYLYMRFRAFLFPIVNIATTFSYLIITFGIIFQILNLIWIGIICVGTGLLFQIVTLPVEINASKRAEKEINKLKLADKKEIDGIKQMLTSAASTYLAGVLSSALELLRLILAFSDRDQ